MANNRMILVNVAIGQRVLIATHMLGSCGRRAPSLPRRRRAETWSRSVPGSTRSSEARITESVLPGEVGK